MNGFEKKKIRRVLDLLLEEDPQVVFKKIGHLCFQMIQRCRDTKQHKILLEDLLNKKSGRNVIVYPPTVDWGIPLFQRPQHFAINFSKLGHLFFFCSPNGPHDNIRGVKELAEDLYITNRYDILMRKLSKAWVIVSSTNFTVTIGHIRAWKTRGFGIIYDYIDKIDPLITGNVDKIIERSLALRDDDVDLITVSAISLYNEMTEKFSKEKVKYVPNAVEYEHFHIKKIASDCPFELRNIVYAGKPIIGYYGALAKWIDYELINKIAAKRRDWNVVLIGHDYDGSAKAINNEINIKQLGPKNYRELPKYAIWFDVAIIPFREGEIAKTTSPLKLFEYMAMNKPVVVTKDLTECHKYDGIFIAKDASDFIEKIEEGLKLKDDLEYLTLLDSQARQNTWEQRAIEIDKWMEQCRNKTLTG